MSRFHVRFTVKSLCCLDNFLFVLRESTYSSAMIASLRILHPSFICGSLCVYFVHMQVHHIEHGCCVHGCFQLVHIISNNVESHLMGTFQTFKGTYYSLLFSFIVLTTNVHSFYTSIKFVRKLFTIITFSVSNINKCARYIYINKDTHTKKKKKERRRKETETFYI